MPIFIVQLVKRFNTIFMTLLVLHSLEVQAVQSDAQASSFHRSHKSRKRKTSILFTFNKFVLINVISQPTTELHYVPY